MPSVDEKRRPNIGRIFLLSGCAASAAVILISVYLVLSHSPRGAETLGCFLLAIFMFGAFVMMPPVLGIGYGVVFSMPIISITHGLVPLMLRNWRWIAGTVLWLGSLMGLAVGLG